MQEHRLRRGRLVGAIAAALAVVLSSPFVVKSAPPSSPRSLAIRTDCQQRNRVSVAVALLLAVITIREHRMWRYAALVLAVGGAMLYAQLVATGNVLVDVVEHVHFVEYGLVAWLFYRACRVIDNGAAIIWPLLAGTLTGIADESLQAFIPERVGEAHDVLLNVVAVGCGLCFAASVSPPTRLDVPLRRPVVRPIAYGLVSVLIAFAGFFHAVHLGHEVYEPDIGVFWSHYDAATLKTLADDRNRPGGVVTHPRSSDACRTRTNTSAKRCGTYRSGTARGEPAMCSPRGGKT
jgi:VanZ family protein